MRGKRYIAGVAAVLAASGLAAAGGSAAGAADSDFAFYGDAAGARVHALNGTITSSVSAESGVYGGPSPQTNSNHAAAATLQGIATVGAVNTSTQIKQITGGWEVQAVSQTAGVSLLNGLIKATAVTTTATITEIGGQLAANVKTDFADLHIVGIHVPVNIPPNWAVKVGNIAQIGVNTGTWNVQNGASPATTAARAIGAGLQVRLLEPAGSAETGASIYVSPVDTLVGPNGNTDTGHTNGGLAYGTKITANVGTLVNFRSDPTAPVAVYTRGTDDNTTEEQIAKVRLGLGLNVGAVDDTGFGHNDDNGATTIMTSRVATANLFSGLIKLNAITANARAESNGTVAGSAEVLGLSIAGKPISVATGPNTEIDVLHLGQVWINRQIRTPHGITVIGLDVVLGTKRNGLPAGAEIQVAYASAQAT